MNKIQKALTEKKKKSFIPYIMAGDGGLECLKERLLFLQKCGADAIEIGIPFSDPVADGPTIQRAGLRALKNGTTLKKVLETIKGYKNEIHVPLLFMSYLNPIVAYGITRFAEDARNAGISGCIIPDLPLEEEEIIVPLLEANQITFIRLVTLTTPHERLKEIAKRSSGFLYAVTVTGITGSRKKLNHDLASFLRTVRELSPIPVLAGFGISTAEQIEEACMYSDGVIVGSRIIELFEENDLVEIEQLISATAGVKM